MKYWLVNESAPHYNLGLEKARNWLLSQGHEVQYSPFSMEARAFDAVWFSVIFSWHLPRFQGVLRGFFLLCPFVPCL